MYSAQNINSDLLVAVGPLRHKLAFIYTLCYKNKLEKIRNQIWFMSYGKELQVLVIIDREFDFSYYDIHAALLNIFLNDKHAISIFECYTVRGP